MDIFEWRRAFMTKNGPHPTTRLVLFAISTYMDTEGGNAYPTVRSLAKATGLHRQTVMRRIREARDDGWVKVIERPGRGGIRHSYSPALPTNTVAEADRARNKSGWAVQGGGRSLQPGAVVQDDLTSTETSPKTSLSRELEPFEEFRKTYPHPHPNQTLELTDAEWERARAAFQSAETDAEEILTGCRRYAIKAAALESFYVTSPAKWLRDRGWTAEWNVSSGRAAPSGLGWTPEEEAAAQRLREMDRELGVDG